MGYAGTPGMVWGWLIAMIFIQCVAMSMAEICSSMPTSGGLYYASAVSQISRLVVVDVLTTVRFSHRQVMGHLQHGLRAGQTGSFRSLGLPLLIMPWLL